MSKVGQSLLRGAQEALAILFPSQIPPSVIVVNGVYDCQKVYMLRWQCAHEMKVLA